MTSTYSILLRGSNLLDSEGVIEQAVAREVLTNVLLDQLDTQIRVVDALDLVANAADYEYKELDTKKDSANVYTH